MMDRNGFQAQTLCYENCRPEGELEEVVVTGDRLGNPGPDPRAVADRLGGNRGSNASDRGGGNTGGTGAAQDGQDEDDEDDEDDEKEDEEQEPEQNPTACTSPSAGLVDRVLDYLLEHGDITLSLDAGRYFGVNGSVSLTRQGISGNVGAGFGMGFGAALTTGVTAGQSSGWNVTFSGSGGTGLVEGSVSASSSRAGLSGSAGVGVGVGAGVTGTFGYSGNIYSFAPSPPSSSSQCTQ
jgi:hypothetical protein